MHFIYVKKKHEIDLYIIDGWRGNIHEIESINRVERDGERHTYTDIDTIMKELFKQIKTKKITIVAKIKKILKPKDIFRFQNFKLISSENSIEVTVVDENGTPITLDSDLIDKFAFTEKESFFGKEETFFKQNEFLIYFSTKRNAYFLFNKYEGKVGIRLVQFSPEFKAFLKFILKLHAKSVLKEQGFEFNGKKNSVVLTLKSPEVVLDNSAGS